MKKNKGEILLKLAIASAMFFSVPLQLHAEESDIDSSSPTDETTEVQEPNDTDELQTENNDTDIDETDNTNEDNIIFYENEAETNEDESDVYSNDSPSPEEAPILTSDADALKAALTFTDVNEGSQTVELTEDGQVELVPTVGYKDTMTLTIDATFGEGTDKTIEITLPEGMTFRKDIDESSGYLVYNTDDTLKEIITPNQQTDPAKQNISILNIDQMNGTLTLKFHGSGEDNDAERVLFSVPVQPNGRVDYNRQVWESGIAWYYDSVTDPIIVTESYTNSEDNTISITKSLNLINIKNTETVRYQNTWTSSLNPEVALNQETSGGVGFRVQTIPNGSTYVNKVAVKKYSITLTAPEGTEFVGFNNAIKTQNKTTLNNNYTYAETTAGNTTPDGMTVEEGRVAFTFTVTDTILHSEALLLYPIWKFTTPLKTGDQALIKVEDVHAQFWARDTEHPFDRSKFPSITYNIVEPEEEIFINVTLDNKDRYTDGYIADSTLNLGAPGYEHIQERQIGYFIIGNRGQADSVAKRMTYSYDVNNTGTYGVTQQELPSLTSESFEVTAVRYKLYNAETGDVDSTWTEVTEEQLSALRKAKSNYLNLTDVGIDSFSGNYFKEIQVDITTIPKYSYLRTGQTVNRNTNYNFLGRVLNEKEFAVKRYSELEAALTISDLDGGQTHKDVTGYVYNGSSGNSIIVMSYDGYASTTSPFGNYLEVGAGSQQVKVGVYDHDWATANAQDIKAIYIISPFGEPIENMTLHYPSGNATALGFYPLSSKRDTRTYYTDSLELNTTTNGITYTEVTELSDALTEKYPDAKLYKIDFTGVTNPQEVYDKRIVGTMIDTKQSSKSSKNASLITTNRYNGIAITYDLAPNIKDIPGTYSDVMWVEYDEKGKENVKYVKGGHHDNLHTDKFSLTGSSNPDLRLSLLQPLYLLPTEELVVTSSAKQDAETDDFYKTYVSGDDSTILGVYDNIDYKLTVANYTSTTVSDFSVYWPVPKAGENWGSSLNPEGAFNFSMNLTNALQNVPENFTVSYAKNVSPTGSYENWDTYSWTEQKDTADWTVTDWNEVNFVRIVRTETEEVPGIEPNSEYNFVFDLAVDSVSTTDEQMYTLDTWAPYFRRTYTHSTSWVAGAPVSAMLTPGKINGTVWDDTNYNGNLDEGEPIVSGVTVYLYDISTGSEVLRMSTTTDTNGSYEFNGLFDGLSESGLEDSSRIVIERPTTQYIDFTKFAGEMAVFSPYQQDDHLTNAVDYVYVDVTMDRTSQKILNAGLIKEIPILPLHIEKIILNDTSDELKDTVFRFAMNKNGETVDEAEVQGAGTSSFEKLQTVKLNTETVFTISELPTGNPDIVDDTTVYTRTIKTEKRNGIWHTIESITKDGETASVVFTNEFKPVTTSISVEKVWEDNDDKEHQRPSEIIVTLLEGNNVIERKTLTEDGKWTDTFENVRVYRNGTAINYTVGEVTKIDGYKTKIEGNSNDGFIITNSYQPSPAPTPSPTPKPIQPTHIDPTNKPAVPNTSVCENNF